MIRFISSIERQIKNFKNNAKELKEIFVLTDEDFAVQLELFLDKKIWVNLNKDITIPWNGLTKSLRIDINTPECISSKIQFEIDVLDDDNIYKKDKICSKSSSHLDKGYSNLWVDLKSNKEGEYQIYVNVYERNGFEDEKLIYSKPLTVKVSKLKSPKENVFFLDLWQHLSSLARYYNVELFSDEHFEIIKKFISPLAKAGQKVCNLIVSDYSWAGQGCSKVRKNKSSLYEYNIIKVFTTRDEIKLDFTAFDRYIKLCKELNMASEINIFGLLGNWSEDEFNIPIKNYDEIIRVRAYDLENDTYTFLKTREQIEEYVKQIFVHLDELGLLSIVKVISDTPKCPNSMSLAEKFIINCYKDVKFKYAINDGNFLKNYNKDIESSSIILDEFLKERISTIKEKSRNMSWYVCWTPKNFNQFVKSPLIESRLVGYLTYLFDMKGFLRWNYCLYTDSENPNYKSEEWATGDMYFVYPSKDGRPLLSLRFKELCFGIADYNFLKYCEKKLGRKKILEVLSELVGEISDYKYDEKTRELNDVYAKNYEVLNLVKEKLANKVLELK